MGSNIYTPMFLRDVWGVWAYQFFEDVVKKLKYQNRGLSNNKIIIENLKN